MLRDPGFLLRVSRLGFRGGQDLGETSVAQKLLVAFRARHFGRGIPVREVLERLKRDDSSEFGGSGVGFRVGGLLDCGGFRGFIFIFLF